MCLPPTAGLPDLSLPDILPVGARGIITAADGGTESAYAVSPDGPATAGVLVLPDLAGLWGFYERLACAIASQGRHALAIDWYGRTAGTHQRDDEYDPWEHGDIEATRMEHVRSDIAAGVVRLREMGAERVGVLGFCFGGGMIWRLIDDEDLGVDRAVAFYGPAREWNQYAEAYGALAAARWPVLAIFGGGDENIPVTEVDAIDTALDRSGIDHEVLVYPEAPHSFFDGEYADWADACRDSWRRTLDFLPA